MAWALQFDGVNDNYLQIPRIDLSDGDVVNVTFSNYVNNPLSDSYIFGVASYGFRIFVTSSGYIQLEDRSYYTAYLDGVELANLDTLMPDDNGVEHTLSVVFNSSARRLQNPFSYYGGSTPTLLFHKLEIVNRHLWDGGSSNRDATGVQPVFYDQIGSTDAIGVNFPTDGSAWVDLGGGTPSLTLDIPLVDNSGNSNVFTPIVLVPSIIDMPVTEDNFDVVYNPTLLSANLLSLPITYSDNTQVNEPTTLLSKLLTLPTVDNSAENEVYALTVSIPRFIEQDEAVEANARVFNLYVLDGEGILIPVEDRVAWSKIANYLRSLGFKGNNNDVIIQWLTTEGVEKSDYNSMLNSYLISQGYTEGGLNDKYKLWTRG